MNVARPEPTEYAPYYEKYISLVPGDELTSVLESQGKRTVQLLAGRGEKEGNFRYAPNKWTIKEVLGHISDTERIFIYRALRIARGDSTPLASFEQDDYVRAGEFNARTLHDLLEDFASVRGATSALFRSLHPQAWTRRGVANNQEVSVRALAYMTAGHELHHVKILEERYFPEIPRT